MFDIGLSGAFIAGLLSFISPCVLPLVPPYLCYVAGVSLDQLVDQAQQNHLRKRIMLSSFAFVLGFSTIFMLLGATASLLGSVVTQYAGILSMVAGGIIIILGIHFTGLFRLNILYKEARFQPNTQKLTSSGLGMMGAYIVGLAFAFGWTPCVGPVLAAILFMAGSEDSLYKGLALLSAYSAGLGIPFLCAALFASQFMGFMKKFRHHLGKIEKLIGILLIITGILFVTGDFSTLSFWLLEAFPILGEIG